MPISILLLIASSNFSILGHYHSHFFFPVHAFALETNKTVCNLYLSYIFCEWMCFAIIRHRMRAIILLVLYTYSVALVCFTDLLS